MVPTRNHNAKRTETERNIVCSRIKEGDNEEGSQRTRRRSARGPALCCRFCNGTVLVSPDSEHPPIHRRVGQLVQADIAAFNVQSVGWEPADAPERPRPTLSGGTGFNAPAARCAARRRRPGRRRCPKRCDRGAHEPGACGDLHMTTDPICRQRHIPRCGLPSREQTEATRSSLKRTDIPVRWLRCSRVARRSGPVAGWIEAAA